MLWPPDSRWFALVDHVYAGKKSSADSQSEGEGEQPIRRCSLAVVSKNSEAVLFVLNDFSEEDLRKLSMSWIDPGHRKLSKVFFREIIQHEQHSLAIFRNNCERASAVRLLPISFRLRFGAACLP